MSRIWLIAAQRTEPAPLLRAIAGARQWYERIATGEICCLEQFAKEYSCATNYISPLLKLGWLSPQLVEQAVANPRKAAESLDRAEKEFFRIVRLEWSHVTEAPEVPGTQKKGVKKRAEIINLRATTSQKALIDRAVAAIGRNRSEFMLEAACREAKTVLLSHRYFALSDEDFLNFVAALDRAPKSNPKLRRLLKVKPPWNESSGNRKQLSLPEKLRPGHDLSVFRSGEATSDYWLRHRAHQYDEFGGSRAYIVRMGTRVAAYYALALGTVAHAATPGLIRRDTPDPMPIMVIEQIAVDQPFQGQKIGSSLLRDALSRTLEAADVAGIRAILVHIISERGRRFYEERGFMSTPFDSMTVMITTAEVGKEFGDKDAK